MPGPACVRHDAAGTIPDAHFAFIVRFVREESRINSDDDASRGACPDRQ